MEKITGDNYEATGSKTVLLVDDEPELLKAMSRFIKRQGYEVLEASSGEVAMRVWSEHASKINLLLTDVVMPGINGVDLAKNLLNLKPDLKVLLVSGYVLEDLKSRFGLPDSMPLLEKPFTLQLLTKTVGDLFAISPAKPVLCSPSLASY